MMPAREVRVTVEKQRKGQVAEVFTTGVLAWAWLLQTGIVDEAKRRLHLQRKSGCTGVDLFGQLVLMWMSLAVGQRALQEKAESCKKELATVIGSKSWYGQSCMSRTFDSVTEEQGDTFGDWLLNTALPVGALERDGSTCHRDTFGAFWRVVDVDGRVHAMRQRALPEGEDLPDPVRLASKAAKPGYPGRKRGETQLHQMIIQDAGTGRFLGVRTRPGNGEHPVEMKWAAEMTGKWADQLECPRDHMILRFDGKASGMPSLLSCLESEVQFLTRWTNYKLLALPEIIRRMASGPWKTVEDSGSGPRRMAMELKREALVLRSQLSEHAFRLVVSRYVPAEQEQHGSGKLIDGVVYELFATSLPEDSWPAEAVVELYYGRCAEECRFSQADKELRYQHVISWNPAGQQLACAVGLFTWNHRLAWGAQSANWHPVELPPQLPRPKDPETQPLEAVETVELVPDCAEMPSLGSVVPVAEAAVETAEPVATVDVLPREAVVPVAEAAVETAEPVATVDVLPREAVVPVAEAAVETAEPVATVTAVSTDLVSKSEPPRTGPKANPLVQVSLLATLAWPALFENMPGWHWKEAEQTLYCPADEPMIFHAFRRGTSRVKRALFRIRRTASCLNCPQRAGCTLSTNPKYRKEVWFTVPSTVDFEPPRRAERQTASVREAHEIMSPCPSPLPVPRSAGPFLPIAPALIPSVLRNGPSKLLAGWRVTVESPRLEKRETRVAWLANSKEARQHRRHTFTEREAQSLIPNSCALVIALNAPYGTTRTEQRRVTKTLLSACDSMTKR